MSSTGPSPAAAAPSAADPAQQQAMQSFASGVAELQGAAPGGLRPGIPATLSLSLDTSGAVSSWLSPNIQQDIAVLTMVEALATILKARQQAELALRPYSSMSCCCRC